MLKKKWFSSLGILETLEYRGIISYIVCDSEQPWITIRWIISTLHLGKTELWTFSLQQTLFSSTYLRFECLRCTKFFVIQ